MFDVNVLGTLHVTQALLPKLIASGAGTIVLMGSTAGLISYEGGGGYVVAKHGTHAIAETLRLELYDKPVRIIEIAPGMVKTAEFAVNRFRGDADKAAAVYAGVAEPLTDADVADAVIWSVTRPAALQRGPDGDPAASASRAVQGLPGAAAEVACRDPRSNPSTGNLRQPQWPVQVSLGCPRGDGADASRSRSACGPAAG